MPHKEKVTSERKLQAVEEYLAGKVGYRASYENLGVRKATFQQWMSRYQAEGPAALMPNVQNRSYSNVFHQKLRAAGMKQSMSRVAHCLDNGPMEGFWGILKRECYYGRKFTDRMQLVQMITHYILAPPKERIQRFTGQELKPAPKQEPAKPAGDEPGEYVKVILFPQVRYLKPEERRASPAPMQPVSFQFGQNHVRVDRDALCERTVSRKVGGRGFRCTCYVSWMAGGKRHVQSSVVWYDDFLEEWFVEVLKSRAPVDWDTASQVRDDAE